MDRLLTLWETKQFADLEIDCEGKKFDLHRCIVCSVSQYFGAIDANHATIPVSCPGGSDVFELVAKYCYLGEVVLTPESVVDILCAAAHFCMVGQRNLLAKCVQFIESSAPESLRTTFDYLARMKRALPFFERNDPLRKEPRRALNECVTFLLETVARFWQELVKEFVTDTLLEVRDLADGRRLFGDPVLKRTRELPFSWFCALIRIRRLDPVRQNYPELIVQAVVEYSWHMTEIRQCADVRIPHSCFTPHISASDDGDNDGAEDEENEEWLVPVRHTSSRTRICRLVKLVPNVRLWWSKRYAGLPGPKWVVSCLMWAETSNADDEEIRSTLIRLLLRVAHVINVGHLISPGEGGSVTLHLLQLILRSYNDLAEQERRRPEAIGNAAAEYFLKNMSKYKEREKRGQYVKHRFPRNLVEEIVQLCADMKANVDTLFEAILLYKDIFPTEQMSNEVLNSLIAHLDLSKLSVPVVRKFIDDAQTKEDVSPTLALLFKLLLNRLGKRRGSASDN